MLEDTTVSDTVALLARGVVAIVVWSVGAAVVDGPSTPETAILLVVCAGGRGAEGETEVEEPGEDDSKAVRRARRGNAVAVEEAPVSRRELVMVELEGGGDDGGGEEEGIVSPL